MKWNWTNSCDIFHVADITKIYRVLAEDGHCYRIGECWCCYKCTNKQNISNSDQNAKRKECGTHRRNNLCLIQRTFTELEIFAQIFILI